MRVTRTKSTHSITAIVAALLFMSSAVAEPPLPSQTLVKQVLQANPDLAIAAARQRSLEAHISVAGALPDPMANLAVAPATFDSDIGARGIFQLSQSLPWPGKRELRADAAAALAAAAGSELALRQRELAWEARTAWAQWWYVHRALELNAANQRLLDELLSVVETQYGAGIGGQQDVVQAQTRALHNRHQRIELQQQRKRVAALLNALRDQPADAPLPPPARYPSVPELSAQSLLREAMFVAHPRLSANASQRQRAEAQLALAEREYWPDFTVHAGYVGTLDPAEKRFQVGVGINIPLQRTRRRASEDVARAELLGIAASERSIRAQLDQALVTQISALEEAQHVVHLYRSQLLDLAAQNVNAAKADYESGSGSFTDIITAAEQQLDFQLELASARADALIARAAIRRLVGDERFEEQAITHIGEPGAKQ